MGFVRGGFSGRAGILLYGMEKDSASDARFCIKNCLRFFARLNRFRNSEPEHGVNPARSLFVRLKHAQDKSCGLRR